MTEPKKPVRTRMKAAERREAILDAAELTFAQLGYRGAGMADIAEASGVTQPMLYRHFTSKEELFLAVLDRSMGKVVEMWRSAPDLAAMGTAYTQLAVSSPHTVRLRQMAMAESDPTIRAHMQRLFRSQVAMIREKATAAQDSGTLAHGVTPTGVTWLFTALGMVIDVSVALDLSEAYEGIPEAGALFHQLVGQC